jgi:hypothetical protein
MGDRRSAIREKIAARTFYCEELCGVVGVDTPCHIWQGPDSGKIGRGAGYPRMSLDGQTVAVHLVLWTNENGYIPGRKTIDHICRNRLCINLDHLEMVTMKENARRRDEANGRSKPTRRKRAKKKRKSVDNRKYEKYIPPQYNDMEVFEGEDIPF